MFIVVSVFVLLIGCSSQDQNADAVDQEKMQQNAQLEIQKREELIKKSMMEQMDKLMYQHDKNMKLQRQMVTDYTVVDQIGSKFTQSSGNISNDDYQQLVSAIAKANSSLLAYQQGINSLLSGFPTVENRVNELVLKVDTKQRAELYLSQFKQATQSQMEYVDIFQKLIQAASVAYKEIYKGNNPDISNYNEYMNKEGELIDKFNREIDQFNVQWKILNEQDFNRKVQGKISF